MMTGGWVDGTLGALRDDGYRNGGARRAVVELLGRQDCCLTAQEIFDRLRGEGRQVGIASVYRVLDLLSDKGLVQRIDVGGGSARYEPVHASGEHHHHLVCDDCGKVEPFEDAALEAALARIAGGRGYALEAHEVVLHGGCGACRPPA
jgi:Fur family ferric uptake transcriptional regulator